MAVRKNAILPKLITFHRRDFTINQAVQPVDSIPQQPKAGNTSNQTAPKKHRRNQSISSMAELK